MPSLDTVKRSAEGMSLLIPVYDYWRTSVPTSISTTYSFCF